MLMYTLSLFDFITLNNIRICNIGKKDGSEVIELAILWMSGKIIVNTRSPTIADFVFELNMEEKIPHPYRNPRRTKWVVLCFSMEFKMAFTGIGMNANDKIDDIVDKRIMDIFL